MEKKYNYPAPNNSDAIHCNNEIKKLLAGSGLSTQRECSNSSIEKLLRQMMNDGHEVSAPLIEFIAMRNYIVKTMRGNENIIPLIECVLAELKK